MHARLPEFDACESEFCTMVARRFQTRFPLHCTRLCLASGGVSGALFIGAIRSVFDGNKRLFRRWRSKTLTQVAGCSVGAIVGLSVCAGMGWDECMSAMQRILAKSPMSIDAIRRVASDVLAFAGWAADTTFEQLGAKSGIDFRTVCTDARTGSEYVFSVQHTPTALVVHAVTMSCAVPIIVHRPPEPLLDGMFVDNYALLAFDDVMPASTFAICLDAKSFDTSKGMVSIIAGSARTCLHSQLHTHIRLGSVRSENILQIDQRLPLHNRRLGADDELSRIMRNAPIDNIGRWVRPYAVRAHALLIFSTALFISVQRRIQGIATSSLSVSDSVSLSCAAGAAGAAGAAAAGADSDSESNADADRSGTIETCPASGTPDSSGSEISLRSTLTSSSSSSPGDT
jgi:predicted acylesterase/phospholipase RssA